jgi:uncharacterized SAM-dependent methyltransferase
MDSSSPQVRAVGVPILALLREQEIAEQFQQAFRERYLPEHLFYWMPNSVQAWVDLCRSAAYRNASRAIEVLSIAATDLSGLDGIRALCGIGCGEGSKDGILLKAFAAKANPVHYVAGDFSQSLLELAADHVKDSAASVFGCKLDIFRDEHLAALVEAVHTFKGRALFTVLGNTLGAFGPGAFSRRLRECMRHQDYFVFDGEIFSEQTLSGYDNPVNRRFAWAPLAAVGITEQDGDLDFSASPAGDGFLAVHKRFTASRDLRIVWGSNVLEIPSGATLQMSSSLKYASPATLFDAVTDAGFRIHSEWRSHDAHFVLACATRI